MKLKYILIVIIAIILSVAIFVFINKGGETKIIPDKYPKSVIRVLKDNNVYDEIIKLDYSKTLEEAITSNLYKNNYLRVYPKINYKDDKDFIDSVNKMLDVNYTSDEVNATFDSPYFKYENLSRYIIYKSKNNYDIEKTIMYVNIGLDNSFYTNVKKISNTNDILILVNKYNKLPDNFKADNLVTFSTDYSYNKQAMKKVAHENAKSMIDKARSEGHTLLVVSGYRTEATQKKLFNNSVKNNGEKHALIYSAKPGHSEHQTGLTVDLSNRAGVLSGFEETKVYLWLKENAFKYGFIERYPKGKELITGYAYEPWHYRYVGVQAATIIKNENITLEEYWVKYKGL